MKFGDIQIGWNLEWIITKISWWNFGDTHVENLEKFKRLDYDENF